MVAAFALPLFGFRPFQLGDPATSGEQLRGGEILAKRVFGAFGFGPVDHVGDRVAHVHRDALPSEQPCSLEPPLAEYEPPVGVTPIGCSKRQGDSPCGCCCGAHLVVAQRCVAFCCHDRGVTEKLLYSSQVVGAAVGAGGVSVPQGVHGRVTG